MASHSVNHLQSSEIISRQNVFFFFFWGGGGCPALTRRVTSCYRVCLDYPLSDRGQGGSTSLPFAMQTESFVYFLSTCCQWAELGRY